jgi:hypothetical protein
LAIHRHAGHCNRKAGTHRRLTRDIARRCALLQGRTEQTIVDLTGVNLGAGDGMFNRMASERLRRGGVEIAVWWCLLILRSRSEPSEPRDQFCVIAVIAQPLRRNPRAFHVKAHVKGVGHADTAMHLHALNHRQFRGLCGARLGQ